MADPDPDGPNGMYKVVDDPEVDFYFAAYSDASSFAEAIDGQTDDVVAADAAAARGSVYGGHWGTLPPLPA